MDLVQKVDSQNEDIACKETKPILLFIFHNFSIHIKFLFPVVLPPRQHWNLPWILFGYQHRAPMNIVTQHSLDIGFYTFPGDINREGPHDISLRYLRNIPRSSMEDLGIFSGYRGRILWGSSVLISPGICKSRYLRNIVYRYSWELGADIYTISRECFIVAQDTSFQFIHIGISKHIV